MPAPPGFSAAVASPDQEFTFGLKSKVADTRGDRKLSVGSLDRQVISAAFRLNRKREAKCHIYEISSDFFIFFVC